jgi:hypothetical protein
MTINHSDPSRYEHRNDPYGNDIYTELDGDVDTFANLGPLAPMAGVWEGAKGLDDHPVAEGVEQNAYVEHYELHPADRQTNGPQLFYGLRYHTHIVKPEEAETFHDQVGYWLWEPAAKLITFSLCLLRGQALLAAGHAEASDTSFEVRASRGSNVYGIVSNPFLERAYRTLDFRLTVMINADGTWSYHQETMLELPGGGELFAHTDSNTLTRIGPPTLNPMANAAS